MAKTFQRRLLKLPKTTINPYILALSHNLRIECSKYFLMKNITSLMLLSFNFSQACSVADFRSGVLSSNNALMTEVSRYILLIT